MAYKKQKSEGYLILQSDDSPIAYQSKMIEAVPFLLPARLLSQSVLCVYPGQGEPLRRWLEKEPDLRSLLFLLQTLHSESLRLAEYLLDAENLVWDSEWIFWQEDKGVLEMPYVPWKSVQRHTSLWMHMARLFRKESLRRDWQSEELILFLHRFSRMAYCQKPNMEAWGFWLQKEMASVQSQNAKAHFSVSETALDILTMPDVPLENKGAEGFWQKLKTWMKH